MSKEIVSVISAEVGLTICNYWNTVKYSHASADRTTFHSVSGRGTILLPITDLVHH